MLREVIMEIKGFKFSAVEAAVKKPGRLDFALIYSEVPAEVAAVFTTNKVKAAPVLLSMERVKRGSARAIAVNSGNANACTGKQGVADAGETAKLISQCLGIEEDAVLVASTGVIGQLLPMEKLRSAVPGLVSHLSSDALPQVAQAIMTTDTFTKMETRTGEAGGKGYTIAGVAKGAGMIMPNMATMLSFIVTDAAVDPVWLREIFQVITDSTFNCISVDGDTSTNDTALIMANGAAGNPRIRRGTQEAESFEKLLGDVLLALSMQIVRDGEGATKFVEVVVKGAVSPGDAKKAAMAIANSLLVKTAFFGQDANWGRILAAVGYSGAEIDQDRAVVLFDNVEMVRNGLFTGGNAEALGSEVLKNKEFRVTVDLGLGDCEATVFTNDLSYDYVKINADYRT
jgi:glutamate N-acetyltransferase/amino-acid N-acetyltransferase